MEFPTILIHICNVQAIVYQGAYYNHRKASLLEDDMNTFSKFGGSYKWNRK